MQMQETPDQIPPNAMMGKSRIVEKIMYCAAVPALGTAAWILVAWAMDADHGFYDKYLPWFIPGAACLLLLVPLAFLRIRFRRLALYGTFDGLKALFPQGTVEEIDERHPDVSLAEDFVEPSSSCEALVVYLSRKGRVFRLPLGDGKSAVYRYQCLETELKSRRGEGSRLANEDYELTDFTVVDEKEAHPGVDRALGVPDAREYGAGRTPRAMNAVAVSQEGFRESRKREWAAYVDGADYPEGYRKLFLNPAVQKAVLEVFGTANKNLGIVVGKSIVRIFHTDPMHASRNVEVGQVRKYLEAAMAIARERDALLVRLGQDALDYAPPEPGKRAAGQDSKPGAKPRSTSEAKPQPEPEARPRPPKGGIQWFDPEGKSPRAGGD